MGKKGDGSNSARLVTTVAATGGVFVLRKVLATAWTKITGKVPPTDLTDPKVTLPEVLAWAVATGIVVETGEFAIVRSTMRKSIPARSHGSRVELTAGSAAGQARQPAGAGHPLTAPAAAGARQARGAAASAGAGVTGPAGVKPAGTELLSFCWSRALEPPRRAKRKELAR